VFSGFFLGAFHDTSGAIKTAVEAVKILIEKEKAKDK